MGNQAATGAISLAAGIVAAGAVIILSGGTLTPVVTMLALGAFSAASVAAGIVSPYLLGTPKTNSAQDAISQGLQVSTASESYPIPVIFGTQRLAGNFLRYEKRTFENKKITSSVSAGKGGMSGGSDSQTVGFRYFLSWEYGLCMGPVDYIHKVISNPGEKVCFDNAQGLDEPSNELNLKTGNGEEKGGIILYRGDEDQERNGGDADPYDSDGMRYRHVCWVLFKKKFEIGRNPTPKTYVFEITRWPDMEGLGIKRRGSDDPDHDAYFDANPAAILYEIFTNKVWGRGIDPDLLDIQSFRDCADYFNANKIGMSFTLEGQSTLSDTVDSIRLHVNTIVIWTGGKLVCRCLMDTAQSYSQQIEITKSQVIGEPEFTRPLWNATFNELRCEFTNRKNRYQPDTVYVQDLANIDSVGLINTKKIGLRGFSDRETAQRQANRILREISYPAATLRLYVNRLHSRLIPGDFVRFVWDEWSEGIVTSYWRVVSFSDYGQDDKGIELILQEDQFKPFKEGEEDEDENPIEGWADTPAVGNEADQNEDAYLPFEAGVITPVLVRDLNILITGYKTRYGIFAQRRTGAAIALQVYLGEEGSGEFTDMGNLPCWAITGTTTMTLPESSRQINRAEYFTGTLNHAEDLGDLLEAASLVVEDSDHFDVLTKKKQSLLILGNELIQIGWASEAAGVITFRNMVRGSYGTKIEEHVSGSTFAFIPLWSASDYSQKYESDQADVALDWEAIALTADGLDEASTASFELPETHHKLRSKGVRPLPPEVLSKEIDGTDWIITIRPRMHGQGAGIGSINDWIQSEAGSLGGYSFPIMPDNLTTWEMATATNLTGSGKVRLRYPSAGVTSFKVAASFGGNRSIEFNEI